MGSLTGSRIRRSHGLRIDTGLEYIIGDKHITKRLFDQ